MKTEDTTPRALQDRLGKDSGARLCFGCGADNGHGLRIKSEWRDGEAVCRFTPEAHHHAFPGILNGGIIATLLDCHGIWTAVAHDHFVRQGKGDGDPVTTMFVTRRLTVEYLKPAPMGRELFAVGRVAAQEGRRVTAEMELRDGETLVARAEVLAVRAAE